MACIIRSKTVITTTINIIAIIFIIACVFGFSFYNYYKLTSFVARKKQSKEATELSEDVAMLDPEN